MYDGPSPPAASNFLEGFTADEQYPPRAIDPQRQSRASDPPPARRPALPSSQSTMGMHNRRHPNCVCVYLGHKVEKFGCHTMNIYI